MHLVTNTPNKALTWQYPEGKLSSIIPRVDITWISYLINATHRLHGFSTVMQSKLTRAFQQNGHIHV